MDISGYLGARHGAVCEWALPTSMAKSAKSGELREEAVASRSSFLALWKIRIENRAIFELDALRTEPDD